MTLAEIAAVIAERAPDWAMAGDTWTDSAQVPGAVDVPVRRADGSDIRKTLVIKGGFVIGDRG